MSSPNPSQSQEPKPNDARARLFAHFQNHTTASSPQKWDELWQDSFAPWDQSAPHPGLIDLLTIRPQDIFPPPQIAPKKDNPAHLQHVRRPRALVPGCGKGYDVFLFAAFGWDCWGVEGSKVAVSKAGEMRATLAESEGGVYATRDEKVGRGSAEVVEGDFFDDGWWEGIDQEKGGFDVIYDYTFLSALPPAIRPKWAKRMAQLLAPKGRLVCLEFPTYKEPSTGGPPWAVTSLGNMALLSRPGETPEYDEQGYARNVDGENPQRSSEGLVRIAHFKPERTHEIGKGTDWISVWRHQ